MEHRKVDYLNFDSIYSTDTINDSFDTTFTLNQKYRNIKKIYLKNCEIPIGFPNVRSSNFSNVLRFVLNHIMQPLHNKIIHNKKISTLLTALNSSIVTVITYTGFTFVLSVNTANNIIITSTGGVSSYSIIQSTLSNILNINSAINQTAGTYTSPFIYNLGYDLYIQMSFFNVPSIFSSQGNVPSSLKIPLNTNAYNILYYSTDRQEYDQALTVSDNNFILSQLRIIMYDRFGFPINNGNLEYSFTIAIEYEI